jgi:hypothetical protein
LAVEIAFPAGGMTVSGLRREYERGRLEIEEIAGKQFTTLRAIEEMRERCRVKRKGPDCGSNQRPTRRPAKSDDEQRGSSATDRVKSARAALERTAQALSESSPSISQANIKSAETAAVIPLKSSS